MNDTMPYQQHLNIILEKPLQAWMLPQISYKAIKNEAHCILFCRLWGELVTR